MFNDFSLVNKITFSYADFDTEIMILALLPKFFSKCFLTNLTNTNQIN